LASPKLKLDQARIDAELKLLAENQAIGSRPRSRTPTFARLSPPRSASVLGEIKRQFRDADYMRPDASARAGRPRFPRATPAATRCDVRANKDLHAPTTAAWGRRRTGLGIDPFITNKQVVFMATRLFSTAASSPFPTRSRTARTSPMSSRQQDDRDDRPADPHRASNTTCSQRDLDASRSKRSSGHDRDKSVEVRPHQSRQRETYRSLRESTVLKNA